MQQGQGTGLRSGWQNFCANREYLAYDGSLVAHPADASDIESYEHYFCGELRLDITNNSLEFKLNQIVRDYGGGAVEVLARTVDMDDFEVVQVLTAANLEEATSALANGEAAVLKNISGGSAPIEEYVEWALATYDASGRQVILNQDSFFIACNDTVARCSQMARSVKAKNWVQAASYLRFY